MLIAGTGQSIEEVISCTDISCPFRCQTDQAKNSFIFIRQLRCRRTPWCIPGHMRGVLQSWDIKPDAAQAASPSTGALTEAQRYQERNLTPKWVLHSRWATTIMRLLETSVLPINYVRLTPHAICTTTLVCVQDTSGGFCMYPVSAGDFGASMCAVHPSKLLGEDGRGLLNCKSH